MTTKAEQMIMNLANQPKNNKVGKVDKIFGIGLSRTATTTLYYLMKGFGFKAIHQPSSMKEIEEHFFSNDSAVSARFEELDRRYPNSKFIYTTRSAPARACSSITNSKRAARLEMIQSMSAEVKQWYDESDLNLYGYDQLGMLAATEEELIMAYYQHDERVKSHFRDRPSDLLTIDLTDRNTLPLTTLITFLEQNELISIPQTNAKSAPYSPGWKR